VAGALLVSCYFGYITMSNFHIEIAKARKTYVDQTTNASKSAIHEFMGPVSLIYSADIGVERNLLMRVMFSEFGWLPTGEKNTLEEYGLTTEKQVQRLFKEPPQAIFVAKDYAEPQWAGYQARQGDIFDGGWFGFYRNSGIIELEGDWQPMGQVIIDEVHQMHRYLKRVPRKGGIHLVNTSCKEVVIEIESGSSLSDLAFYDGAGKKQLPHIDAVQNRAKLVFNCDKLTLIRNNFFINVETIHEDYVVSAIYTIQNNERK
jgi:hypothetical protein